MGCQIPPMTYLIIPSITKKRLLVDGVNRFFTIRKFLNDELILNSEGIQKLKFLENKKFSDLTDDERKYFLNCPLSGLHYSYSNGNLNELELDAISKQLYIRYNSGIRLKKEEIQKVDFQDDWVTQQLSQKMCEKDFIEKLTKLSITPKTSLKTFKEKTLMTCRWLITSTYAPLQLFAKARSDFKAVDNYYIDYTLEISKKHILEIFLEIIDCLYELTNQKYWNNYPELHNKYFTMITYWLFFNIKQHHLMNLNDFDWNKYLNAYYKMEQNENFKEIYRKYDKKFHFVMDYLQDEYHVDLLPYIVQIKSVEKGNVITDFSDFPTFNFQSSKEDYNISTFLQYLNSSYVVLRPPYQRHESNDRRAASFLIESSILGIQIPNIILYKYKENGKVVFEVVDGQQRSFAYLAFFNQTYYNIYGEKIESEKQGFSLTGLNVLSELNGKCFKTTRKKSLLDEDYVRRIKEGKIRVVIIPEENNPYFSVRDYFTRINKTICPLRKTSCVYWNAFFDKRIMGYAQEIATCFQETILPKKDKEYKAVQYVLNLAYFFYYNQKEIKMFSLNLVFNWLNKFEIQKSKLANANREEEIVILRNAYLLALKKVEAFLGKLESFLNSIQKTYNELINKRYQRPFTALRSIYYMLGEISEADLQQNSDNIYSIITQFFQENDIKGLRNELEIEKVNFICAKLSMYHNRNAEQKKFTERL